MATVAAPMARGSSRARAATSGALGLGGVLVVAAIYTQLGSLAGGMAPAALLVLCALPVFVLGGALLVRLGWLRAPERGYALTLLAPAVAYYAAFFLTPLGLLVLFSVSRTAGFGEVQYSFSTENFSEALNPLYINIFLKTLRFATLGTLLVIAVGYPLTYWLARYAPANRRNLLLALIIVPFWTSFLIRTYSFLIILDPAFPLSRGLQSAGLISSPLHVLYTGAAVQIGIVYNYLPLFVLPAYAALERLNWTLVDAANDLGSAPFSALRQITLPLAAPGLLTGALLVFIPMMGEYVIPQILGGGKIELMGSVIRRAFLEQQNYPLGAALALVLMGALSVVLVLYLWLTTRTAEAQDA
jgi:spermidine/putrescine transport system permease protein